MVCVKRNFAAMCEGDRIEAEERKRNDKTRKLRGKNQGEKEEEETYRTSFITTILSRLINSLPINESAAKSHSDFPSLLSPRIPSTSRCHVCMYVSYIHGKRPHKTAYRRRIITLSLLAPAFAMIECRGYSYVSPFLSITVENLACVCLM